MPVGFDPIRSATTVPMVRGTAAGLQQSPDMQQLLGLLAALQQSGSAGPQTQSPVAPGPVGGVDPVMSLVALLQQQYGPDAVAQLLRTLSTLGRETSNANRQGSDIGRMTDTAHASALAQSGARNKVDALARATAADRHVKARSAGVDPFAPSFSQEVGHQRAGEDDAGYRQRMVDYKKAQEDKAAAGRAASAARREKLGSARSPWSIEINGQRIAGGTWAPSSSPTPGSQGYTMSPPATPARALNDAGLPLANAQRAQEEEEMRRRLMAAMQL